MWRQGVRPPKAALQAPSSTARATPKQASPHETKPRFADPTIVPWVLIQPDPEHRLDAALTVLEQCCANRHDRRSRRRVSAERERT
jgi:hypothetical protein